MIYSALDLCERCYRYPHDTRKTGRPLCKECFEKETGKKLEIQIEIIRKEVVVS